MLVVPVDELLVADSGGCLLPQPQHPVGNPCLTLRAALLACDKALRALELQAKIEQLIQTSPTFNLHLNTEWITLRTTIVRALEPYPETRESFLKAITSVSNGSTS